MVTVIVGRKTEGSTCRVHTLAQGADEPTYTEFPSKGLSPGTPKWANYVKGVVDKFPGVYSVPTLYFVFVRCIQGRQCLILSMMAARKSAVTESPSASSESRPVHWYDLGIFCMPTFVTLKSKKYNPFLPQPPPPPTPEKQKENNNNKQKTKQTKIINYLIFLDRLGAQVCVSHPKGLADFWIGQVCRMCSTVCTSGLPPRNMNMCED